jgi:predicted ester cyclase
MTDLIAPRRAAARSYLESFASRDPDRIAAHVTDAFINDHASALGSPCTGRDEYRRRLPGFLASLPDLRYVVSEPLIDGERAAVAYDLFAQGTRPDGEVVEVHVRGVMLLWFEGTLISQRLDVWDALTYLRQVGQA